MIQKNTNKKNNQKKPKFNFYWIYGIVLALFLAFHFFSSDGVALQKIKNNQLEELLRSNAIAKIVIKDRRVANIYIKKDLLEREPYSSHIKKIPFFKSDSPLYKYEIGDLKHFEEKLETYKKEYNTNTDWEVDHSSGWFSGILDFLPFIFLLLIISFITRKMMSGSGIGSGGGSQLFNIGKSKAKLFDKNQKVKITFKDVAGLEEAKEEVKEIVDFLKNPEKYTNLGGKIPKGALLVGSPGTGKTLLAKAVAGEADVPFFSISGSDFVEMFVGVGASRVRDLFKEARSKDRAIIFIDEIDAIGRARGTSSMTNSNDERENTLNQLLTEMDGFDSKSNIIVLAATNRSEILDKALLRPGRFDRQIFVDLPELKERKAIFKVHIKPLRLSKDVNIEFLAQQTPGFSGADIANLCNEAALIAARNDHEKVQAQDFLDAVDRIIGGLEKKHKIIAPKEKEAIAYHEAGHATVSWMLEHAAPLVKVTIVPRGQSLGAAWYLPEERSIIRTEQLLDEMCATLGGRAAEEIIFGKISTGALSDLEQVTKKARAMITVYGLNDKIGHVTYYDSSGQSEYRFTNPYSEETARMIDQEIKALIESEYARAKALLEANREKLAALAAVLLEKEVIFKENLEVIFGKRPFEKDEKIGKENPKTENQEEEEMVANAHRETETIATEEVKQDVAASEETATSENPDEPIA